MRWTSGAQPVPIATAGAILLLAISAAISTRAWAQGYPNRPMTMIIPFAAGGAQDVLGRLLAQRLGEILASRS